jgi:hypothetical protein
MWLHKYVKRIFVVSLVLTVVGAIFLDFVASLLEDGHDNRLRNLLLLDFRSA